MENTSENVCKKRGMNLIKKIVNYKKNCGKDMEDTECFLFVSEW